MRYFILMTLSLALFAETQILGLDNSRLSFDFTSRSSYWQEEGQLTQQEFVGLDYHQIINFGGNEFGQLTLQPFLYRIDNAYRTPGVYDDNHDWEFVVRTAVFNYTGLGADKPYIKMGHFEIPFGVEYSKDTFGDLHQYGQGNKMGMKMDWGLALGQELASYKYEFSLTRGSGMKYRDDGDPFAYSGRVSTLNDGPWALGTSFFYGEVLNQGSTIERQIMAVDIEIAKGIHGCILELYGGRQNEQGTWGSLIEVNRVSQDETKELYIQHFYKKISSTSVDSSLVTGVSYRINRTTTLSAQVRSELERKQNKENLVELQFRYRF